MNCCIIFNAIMSRGDYNRMNYMLQLIYRKVSDTAV